MGKSRVFVSKCESYSAVKVKESVKGIFAHFGGAASLFRKGGRIAVKVNLLKSSSPEKAVVTHPSVAFAVCRELQENGMKPFVIDSTYVGNDYNSETLKKVYDGCGYLEIFKNSGIELNYDTGVSSVKVPKGRFVKYVEIITPITKADAVISLAKGKTHGFTFISASVKNLFGVIPGIVKGGFHSRLRNIDNFSGMLVDLAEFIKPKFSIIDAVTCMEGNGPSDGTPKDVGYLIASDNPFAADCVFCDMIKFDYRICPVLAKGEDRGLFSKGDIEITGEYKKIEDFKFPDTFVTADGFVNPSFLFKTYRLLFKDMLTLKPVINKNCIACGLCVKACPEKAIRIKGKRAKIDYKKCIRCYCCHEGCSNSGISFHKGLIYRINKLLKR